MEMSFVVYPNLIATLGGPTHARTNCRSVWVHFPDKVIRMPFSYAKTRLNDGLALGELARVWDKAKARSSCRCPDGPYHYPDCPKFTGNDPFAKLGAAMTK